MKKFFFVFLASALSVTLIPSAAQAGETLMLVAEDSFDYTGNLVEKNGGLGFTSAWMYGSSTSNYGLSDSTLTYPGITSSGGSVNGCSVYNGQLCAVIRSIPLQSSGKVFIQLIINFGAQSGGGTPNLRFYDDASEMSGGVGANGGTYSSKISILNTGLSPNPDGSSSVGTLDGQGFLIIGIDYSLKKTSLWLNPNMATFNYFSTPTPSAVYLDLAPKIQTLLFISRYSYMKFDELKIYKVVSTLDPAEVAVKNRKEAAAVREAERRSARNEIAARFMKSEIISIELFAQAEIAGITKENIEAVQAEIDALPNESRGDITQILKIARKYEVVGMIASGRVTSVYSSSLIQIGLIPADSKHRAALMAAIKKLPASQRSSYVMIKAVIDKKMAEIQAREDRLKAIMARIAARRAA